MTWRLPVTAPRRAVHRGGSALVELVWLGILLLVPMVWIVLSVFEVQRGAFGVTDAARAAGRAFALAPDDATGRQQAEAAARRALADQGLGEAPVSVRVTCTPYPADCHSGTSVITVRVASRVAAAADARGPGRRHAQLRAGRQPHRPDRAVPGDHRLADEADDRPEPRATAAATSRAR